MVAIIQSTGDSSTVNDRAVVHTHSADSANHSLAFTPETIKIELDRYRRVVFCTTVTGTLLLIAAGGVLVWTVLNNVANLSVFNPEFAATIITCLVVGAFLLHISSRMTYALVNECDKQQRLSRQG